MIIDLRFNPGGLLTSAIEVSDLFVAKGRIVSTQGRNTPERAWEAEKAGTFEGFPIVVLVNRYSASASEIVAACLQDHHRAVVVGERTWGKGSVQNVIEMENGHSALKLTTASYKRPNGKNIHRFPDAKETDEWGVHPDPGYDLKLDDGELLGLMSSRHDRDILLVNHYAAKAAAGKPAAESDKPAATETTSDAKPAEQKPAEKTASDKPAAGKPADASGKACDQEVFVRRSPVAKGPRLSRRRNGQGQLTAGEPVVWPRFAHSLRQPLAHASFDHRVHVRRNGCRRDR